MWWTSARAQVYDAAYRETALNDIQGYARLCALDCSCDRAEGAQSNGGRWLQCWSENHVFQHGAGWVQQGQAPCDQGASSPLLACTK
jgi:hypothetical protein